MRYTLHPALPAVVGALLLLDGFLLNRYGGRPMLFGVLVLWGLGASGLILAAALIQPPGPRAIIVRTLMVALVVGVLALGTLLCWVVINDGTQIGGEPETMVVLGANLWGYKPSPILEARLKLATDYLNAHPDMDVVVTGGMGDDEPISEASCMAAYLEEKGIDSKRIYQEDQATNTYENLLFSRQLLEQRGRSTQHLLVVSSSAHLARVRMLAGRCYLKVDTLSAPLPGGFAYKTYFYMREGAALVKSFLVDRG